MIRVERSDPPAVLARHGDEWNAEAIAAVEGGEEYEWHKGRYGHAEVRRALDDMLHRKCAYCESRCRHVTWDHVEHYRPKKAVKENGEIRTPGYYWLGYTWKNLLLACPRCNQSKGSRFPVRGTRARGPTDSLRAEGALLLDPVADEPADHLAFDTATGEVAPRAGSPRGDATIRTCGLDRQGLNDVRRARVDDLEMMEEGYALARRLGDRPGMERWFARMRDATDASAQYAALARAYLDQT